MRNVTAYLDAMKYCLGKTPDSRRPLIDVLNDAGRAIFAEHDWNGLRTGPIDIAAVADQAWLNLPEDFLGIEEAYIDAANGSGSFTVVRQCTLNDIVRYRNFSLNDLQSGSFHVHFPMTAAQTNPKKPPKPIAPCYPTPTVAGQPTIQIYYRRRWREMTTDDGDNVPNIEPDWELAFLTLCEAMAWEAQNLEPLPVKIARYQAELAKLIENDGIKQPRLGPMRGGAGDRGTSATDLRPISSITFGYS